MKRADQLYFMAVIQTAAAIFSIFSALGAVIGSLLKHH